MSFPGDFDVVEHVSGDTCRLVLTGELDLAGAAALREAVARACASEAKEVILDLRRLEFIDSTGLRELLAGEAVCKRHGLRLRLTEGTPRVEHVLELAGLVEHLAPLRLTVEDDPPVGDPGGSANGATA
jgi:anti-sigma B factor antagonist